MSRRQRGGAAGISLFPFLAVLICTMGSLIMLLVLFVQQAKVSAQALIQAEKENKAQLTAQGATELQAAKEEHEWRQQILEQQRAEKTQELSDAFDRLSHLEDHIRRLKSRGEELMKLAQDIDTGKQLHDDEREAARLELERLRKEILEKKKEAEETKKKLANAERWFALIPYDGPNGTRRRPIYIECTEVGIILQPEGIALMPSDFGGPLTAGNPLDAALRMKREYLQRAGETATPYPLLVVRPDGIIAYTYARAAMKAWDDEFGYELIDGEKKLTFGDPDPGLASLMQSTVRTARQRQAALAASVPRKFQGSEQVNSFSTEEAYSDLPGGAPNAGTGNGLASNGYGRGVGTGPGNGAQGSGGVGAGMNRGTDGEGGSEGGGNGYSAGQTSGGTGPNAGGPGFGGGPGQGQGDSNNSAGGQGGTATTVAGGNGKGSATAKTTAGASGAKGGSSNGSTAGQGSTSGKGVAGGSAASGSEFAMNGAGAAPSFMSSSGGGEAGGDDAGATSSSSLNYSAGKKNSRRGANWGLPDSRHHSTAITRPIRVVLEQNRVVIMPERGDDRLPKEIPLKGREMSPQETDQLVTAVQKHMQRWGLAVENGYWKPLLKLEVAPAAENRYQQIETALQGSGFEMQRKVR